MRKLLATFIFFSALAYGDDIDAEIIRDLDFFSNLEVIENHDLVSNLDTDFSADVEPNQESATKEDDHEKN